MVLDRKLKIEVTIWGSGPSSGVPAVNLKGQYWGDCDANDKRNERLRSSVFISIKSVAGRLGEGEEFNILIDASPDFREQYFRYGQGKVIDALFLSHGHYDHMAGINEFKFLLKAPTHNGKASMPLYGVVQTITEARLRYDYLFNERNAELFKVIEVTDYNLFLLGQDKLGKAVQIIAIPGLHGKITSTGFRLGEDMARGARTDEKNKQGVLQGGIAYSPDINSLDEKALAYLQNLDLWIVNCIGPDKEFGHSHLENTLHWIARVKPKQAVLTNLGLKADYKFMSARLKQQASNVFLAYDGQKLLGF